MKFRWTYFFPIWKKNAEKFLSGKKSNIKFQNRGYFGEKNVPQISLNFGHNQFIVRSLTIFQQLFSKSFLSRQKSNFNFQNRGYFG